VSDRLLVARYESISDGLDAPRRDGLLRRTEHFS